MARGSNRAQYLGSAGYETNQKGGIWSFLYSASTSKDALYNIGDRSVTPDGRVFRYSKAGTGGVASEFGAHNANGGGTNNTNTISSHAAPTQTADATGLVGSYVITVTIASTDGSASNGAVAVDELRGGTAIIGDGANQHPDVRGIMGNSAVASGGGTIQVYLDAAITSTIANWTSSSAAANIEILANEYSNVVSMYYTNSAYVTAIGIPAVTATVGQYFWLQTAGKTWATSNSTTNQNANDRNLYFNQNGSLVDGTSALVGGFGDTKPMLQLAGVCMEKTASSHSGPPLLNLQISP